MAFQKLLIQSVLRVTMMSSYMARTSGLASLYSMRPKVDMISPELRRVKAVKTLAGSGNACQKESDGTGCISGMTPKIIAKSNLCLRFQNVSDGAASKNDGWANAYSNRRLEKFFEEEAGEAAGVVAEDAVFFKEIVEDDAEAELLERGEIDGDGLGALCAVTASDIG